MNCVRFKQLLRVTRKWTMSRGEPSDRERLFPPLNCGGSLASSLLGADSSFASGTDSLPLVVDSSKSVVTGISSWDTAK